MRYVEASKVPQTRRGKGRKVRRDVTAGRHQVDTFPSVCVEPASHFSRASETMVELVPLERWTIAVGEGCLLHAYMPTEDIHAPLTILRVTIILESIFESVYKESNRVVVVKER